MVNENGNEFASNRIALAESASASGFDSGVKVPIQMAAQGTSGSLIYSGQIREEYLANLMGMEGAKVWDKMRRSESQIAMLLAAICNPIKSADWDVDPFDDSEESVKQAEFIKFCLMEGIDFEAFLHEALTFIAFGFSIFEVVHNVVFNNKKFGTYNGLASLGFRGQKTIYSWNVEPKTGKLISVDQWAEGDLKSRVPMDAQFLVVFSNLKEGDNYEGISALRPMYGPWFRKNLYLKMTAIGVEKYAVGTPIGTAPAGKEQSKEMEQFKTLLQNFTSHQSAYLIKPAGWEVEIQKNDFDSSKIAELLRFENVEMINACVANFLALGTGGTGSFALGTDLSDFFLSGIQSYANIITGTLNRGTIPNLIKLNFGDQEGYPKLKCTGINDKAGKELAEVVQLLTASGAITTDMPLEQFLRKRYTIPPKLQEDIDAQAEKDAADLAAVAAAANAPVDANPTDEPPTGGGAPGKKAANPNPEKAPTGKEDPRPAPGPTKGIRPQLNEINLQLAEDYSKAFDKNKLIVKSLMTSQLRIMFNGLKDKLRRSYNSATPSQKINAYKTVSTPGVPAYKALLKEQLAVIALDAISGARKEVPSKKNVKFVERMLGALKFAAYDPFSNLNPIVQKLINAQVTLIADTQVNDIEKATFFQFASSVTSSEDIDVIMKDIEDRVGATVDGDSNSGMNLDTGAGNATATITQGARSDFFDDPDVSDGIESFTFTNEDPVSEICQNLAGQTFAVDDPNADRYAPPLHHNCKSRLVPNLKGDPTNPDITGIAINAGTTEERNSLEKQITLCEHLTEDSYRLFS